MTNNKAHKYLCCGCMSVVMGTKVISGLYMLENFLVLISWMLNGGLTDKRDDYSDLARIVITIFDSYGVFIGIKNTNRFYLIPFLGYLCIRTITTGVGCMCHGSVLNFEKLEFAREMRKAIKEYFKNRFYTPEEIDTFICMFVGICLVIIEGWFLNITYKCYKYLAAKKKSGHLP